VRRELDAWLDAASERGSGDDITLGLLVRHRGFATLADVPTIGFEAQA
jgi:hypothetical protein